MEATECLLATYMDCPQHGIPSPVDCATFNAPLSDFSVSTELSAGTDFAWGAAIVSEVSVSNTLGGDTDSAAGDAALSKWL